MEGAFVCYRLRPSVRPSICTPHARACATRGKSDRKRRNVFVVHSRPAAAVGYCSLPSAQKVKPEGRSLRSHTTTTTHAAAAVLLVEMLFVPLILLSAST